MPNPLFNRFGNQNIQRNNNGNMLSQLARLKNDPGYILDILLQSGKINQQQYNNLQPYRNNPEAIGKYLINNGHGKEIQQAEQLANQFNTQA